MKVKEIMSEHPNYVDCTLSVEQAAQKMLKEDIGFLLIGDKSKDRLVGVLTDRDIATRCIAKKLDPAKTTVKDIMTPEVWYCYENDDLEKAAMSLGKMQVHRLAVLDGNKKIVGVLSIGDIASKASNLNLLDDIMEKICA